MKSIKANNGIRQMFCPFILVGLLFYVKSFCNALARNVYQCHGFIGVLLPHRLLLIFIKTYFLRGKMEQKLQIGLFQKSF